MSEESDSKSVEELQTWEGVFDTSKPLRHCNWNSILRLNSIETFQEFYVVSEKTLKDISNIFERLLIGYIYYQGSKFSLSQKNTIFKLIQIIFSDNPDLVETLVRDKIDIINDPELEEYIEKLLSINILDLHSKESLVKRFKHACHNFRCHWVYDIPSCRKILEYGLDPNEVTVDAYNDENIRSSIVNNKELLSLLIPYGQRLDFVDGRTMANLITSRRSDIIQMLLDNGVSSQVLDSFNISKRYYNECLEYEAMGFDREKVSYLLGSQFNHDY
jgi:hypothetical protein